MPPRAADLDCVAFDAYGTLFDVAGAEWGPPEVVQTFRRKQLEYTWQTSLMDAYQDFDVLTRAAIDYANELHGAGLDVDAILELQRRTPPFPEVAGALTRLRGAGLRLAIVSNGRPDALEALATAGGIRQEFAAIVSVHPLAVFKPSPRVYEAAVRELGLEPRRLLFVSSNGWDAAGAGQYGLTVGWVNRQGAPTERIGPPPALIVRDLAELADRVLG